MSVDIKTVERIAELAKLQFNNDQFITVIRHKEGS